MAEDSSVLTRPAAEPDRVLRYGDEPEHVADVWLSGADEGRPLVVLVHGGFWRAKYDRAHTRPMAVALRESGRPVASIEYRRVPGRPDDTLADVRAALEALPGELGADRVVLAGHSAGGQLALWAAVACPPAGLLGTVALAPVADLALAHRLGLGGGAVAAFLGGPPRARGDLDPVRMAGPAAPVVLVHGEQDVVVPPALSESYVEENPGARLVLVPGAAHFAVIDPRSEAWATVLAEVAALHSRPDC